MHWGVGGDEETCGERCGEVHWSVGDRRKGKCGERSGEVRGPASKPI